MRPLSSMDRMAGGEPLGQCPTCGGLRWWDNVGRKAAGELSPSAPDYACVQCRHGRWRDGRHEPGNARARRPQTKVTVLAPETPPSSPTSSGKTCAALTKAGTPCRNGAMAGSPYCGPHTDRISGRPG
jgi:hypothetical protein